MNAIFEALKVNYILLEEGDKEVTIDAVITQNGMESNSRLFIDLSDLNQLLCKLQSQGIELSLSENFRSFQLNNTILHQLDMKELGIENTILENFTFNHPIKQIRA